MTRDRFVDLLHNATTASVIFARRYVENELSDSVRFHVLLNQSNDSHAKIDELVFPEDDGREFQSLTADAVADLLVRDGRCPQWINVAVESQSDQHTIFRLECCGRYCDDEQRMYYTHQGTGQFGIKSPYFPFDYVEGTKFRI